MALSWLALSVFTEVSGAPARDLAVFQHAIRRLGHIRERSRDGHRNRAGSASASVYLCLTNNFTGRYWRERLLATHPNGRMAPGVGRFSARRAEL